MRTIYLRSRNISALPTSIERYGWIPFVVIVVISIICLARS